MDTNKNALDTFQWLYRAYIQDNNCSVANAYADVVRNALQTQAELEAKNRELSRQIDNLIKENAKYEERHKAWSAQVYLASPTPMLIATRTTEYGDDSGTIPVANITDLLDKQADLVELLKSGNYTYLGGEYVFCLKPDEVKKALARAEGRE